MSNPLRPSKRPGSTSSPLRTNRGGAAIKKEQRPPSRLGGGAKNGVGSSQSQASRPQGKFQEFNLHACTADDLEDVRHHIMRFQTKNKVSPKEQFVEPVRLHRKDPKNMQFQLTLSEQQDRKKRMEEEREQREEEEAAAAKAREENKKPEADMSVVAPDGNARKKNQPFQKKTRQIHTMDEEVRKLRYEEYYPWVMEDFEGDNTWVGAYEAGHSDTYALFVFDEANGGFKMVPAEKWYRMTPRNKFRTFTLEEAEKQMEDKKKPNRWIMKQLDKEKEERATNTRRTKFKGVARGPKANEDEEDIDYDENMSDDEEAPIMEGGEDELKEVEDRIKKEQRSANTFGSKEDDINEEQEKKMDKEGRRLRKYLRSLEKNQNYSSDDDDVNPYASEEESGDDLFNETDNKEVKEEKEEKNENEGGVTIKKEKREKKVYANLPPGVCILQLSTSFLSKFQRDIWNPNAKRPREDDIQPANTAKKLKKSTSASPEPAPTDPNLLTESDVRPIIESRKVKIRDLLRELNPKLRRHPDNQKRLKQIISRIARLHEEHLVLRE